MSTKRKTDVGTTSRRKLAHAKMLEAAQACPGVDEAMHVYGGWREKDRGLDAYRSATKKPMRIVTTNSSEVC